MRSSSLAYSSVCILTLGCFAIAPLVGCGDSGGGSGGSASATTSSSKTSATSGSTTTSSATTSSVSGTTSSSSTGSGGNGPSADQLLISEIAVTPDGAEFVEIWNPTAAAVPLDTYYLSDNSSYPDFAAGMPWAPITTNPGTDFLGGFPAGATIAAGAVIVIGFDPGYSTSYPGKCPDYFVATAPVACNNAMVPAMTMPAAGSITDAANLSNAREMVVLFTWDGTVNHPVKDVDYVTWGDMFEAGSRADKTGVTGYQPDTAVANQKPAAAPVLGQSIERCGIETGETLTGGNGITGHDETSENLTTSFVVQAAPSPGTKNSCL